ncbi:MAG: YkgJ family cysteine cluster protein [Methanomassiliicoccaceae archaeon]|nr:YkgJ family cysteine cluster protein [Methanomassiliicoccaceae archaeon]MCL2145661.1 YkgJ family cysteine cluster protein [Methanomassiliicoccaceae archaeon]
MAVYKGKYVLQGLKEITPEMEKDLDIAYEICMSYKDSFPCEMCGRCCRQPNIAVLPEEVDRIADAADIPLHDFIANYIVRTSDGRLLLRKTDPCAFLGGDNRCRIWKDRPEICRDFPYAVSMFMSRVYIALTNDDADVVELINYMDDSWPCTKVIRSSISRKIEEARAVRRNGA